MIFQESVINDGFDSQFKLFHELMAYKVSSILLISTPYDAWVMENDCRLSEQIINEYRGLNLSHPPKLTWVSSIEQAINILKQKFFDIIIEIPRLSDINNENMGKIIKQKFPNIPLILLSHNTLPSLDEFGENNWRYADRVLVWSGNTDLLVALIKNTEDNMNVDADTNFAGVRVIIFVEDTPFYISSLLPILYRELVVQTQAAMEGTLNEDHRLLTMKARPKILLAENYDEAISLYEKFEPYVLGIVSDVSFKRNKKMCEQAGIKLLSYIKQKRFDIPLLLTSSDSNNRCKAEKIPATFVDKNSETLHQDVRRFFKKQLGFGNFVFYMPDSTKIGEASSLKSFEKKLLEIPEESFIYHCRRNDFSRWLFARTEVILASKVRLFRYDCFNSLDKHRKYLASTIRNRIKKRQQGIVADFNTADFETEFLKIGKGSLGGKARGLAFVISLLGKKSNLKRKYKNINFIVPQTLVITTDGFESFIESNNLSHLAKSNLPDNKIVEIFIDSKFPSWLEKKLRAYLKNIDYPLAIRSSSLLEDAQLSAYAGLYKTYMITNDHPNFENRITHLLQAIKMVYASTYFKGPKDFSKQVGHRTEEEQMAIIIQKVVGSQYNDYFYPAISGIAQSYNYYPFAHMKPEEGITSIVMGLGKMVTEGEKALRFSPVYPQLLPQLSTVEDILKNSQRSFYSLKMEKKCHSLKINDAANLFRQDINKVINELPMQILSSRYIPIDHRIRDTTQIDGYPVLTFANILKNNYFPLSEILQDALKIGQQGIRCSVELEFSVNFHENNQLEPEFAFLQLRPMAARAKMANGNISKSEKKKSFCFSSNALGNTKKENIFEIIYVKPDKFDPTKTREIAQDIGYINNHIVKKNSRYLLIGPGRWGSADKWLGIPVSWTDISRVGAIVETLFGQINASPSQGAHFFHNITTRDINYITISNTVNDFLDWNWITKKPINFESEFVSHIKLNTPITIKIDGKSSNCVIFE